MSPEAIWYVLAGIPVFIQLVLLLIPFRDPKKDETITPLVSVLLAVRNEEELLPGCLDSLLDQDYPADHVELIIGNDGSTDNTAHIIQEYATEHPQIQNYPITHQATSSVGKANVLTQIANEAKGEILLITDADTRPNRHWIRNVVAEMEGSKSDMLVGVTSVTGRSMLEVLQNFEWIIILSIMKVLSDLGIPVTGLGNNMAVRSDAYFKSGGYADLPDSITEDFALVRRFKKAGLKILNSFQPGTLASTYPLPNLSKLLNQRKRWMKGAFRINAGFVLVLLIYSIYIISIIMTFAFNPTVGFVILITKYTLTYFLLMKAFANLKLKLNDGIVLQFEMFWELFWFVSLVYYILPVKIEWKGREY